MEIPPREGDEILFPKERAALMWFYAEHLNLKSSKWKIVVRLVDSKNLDVDTLSPHSLCVDKRKHL